MPKRQPRELLPEILSELDELRVELERDGRGCHVGEWANPLMNLSTDCLRRVADLRDGVQKAAEIYPYEWFERIDSPDLDDPDMSAWHDLADWFTVHSIGLDNLDGESLGPYDEQE